MPLLRSILGLVLFLLLVMAGLTFVGLIAALTHSHGDDATTYATLFAGVITAAVVVWQGYLIKQQIAFSTYLDLDNEWNSEEMLTVRKAVHAPGSEDWDDSLL